MARYTACGDHVMPALLQPVELHVTFDLILLNVFARSLLAKLGRATGY